jgi:hypothetical protein
MPWDPAVTEAALSQFLESVQRLDERTGLSPAWMLPLSIISAAGLVAACGWTRRHRPLLGLRLGASGTAVSFWPWATSDPISPA